MLDSALQKTIATLIAEKHAKIGKKPQAPNDFATLREYVLRLELVEELNFLTNILNHPNSFADEFKKRCAWRLQNPDKAISLLDMPNSITNQLYWDIADIVFKPKSMCDMLAIVLESVHNYLDVNLYNQFLPNSKRVHAIRPDVRLLPNLFDLREAPSIEQFANYVLDEDTLLDVRALQYYSLPNHAHLQEILKKRFPELAKKLYWHNASLKTLDDDIFIYMNKGLTAKVALNLLIQDFALGGSHITGSEYAGKIADAAYKRFFGIYNALSNESKLQLRALKANNKTLGSVIDEELELGLCVETTAGFLAQIVQKNKDNAVLNQPLALSLADLKDLENKYSANTQEHRLFDTKKDGLFIEHLPNKFVVVAIENLGPLTIDSLTGLLLNFPTNLYLVLFQHLTLIEVHDNLLVLANVVALRFFNEEQRHKLAAAMAATFSRFTRVYPFLVWAMKTQDPIFLQEALTFYPEQDLSHKLQQPIGNEPSVMHWAAEKPEILALIFKLIGSDEEKTRLILLVNDNGDSVLHRAATNSVALKMMLPFIPEPILLEVFDKVNHFGDTVLHKSTNDYDSLVVSLDLYPAPDQLVAVKRVNGFKSSVLHRAAHDIRSLALILNAYPEPERLAAVILPNQEGITVLHQVAFSRDSIKLLFQLVPETNWLTLFHYPISGTSIVQLFIEGTQLFPLDEAPFKDSFIPRYIEIRKLLKALPVVSATSYGNYFLNFSFFNTKTPESRLVDDMNKCNTFDEIKSCILDYANTPNLNTDLSKRLLNFAEPEKYLMLCD
ncbi:MAG: hypothetical protein WC627_03890 [Legionella sp.]|jgi:hypothetical protein